MQAVAVLGLALGMMGATSVQAQITIPTVMVGDAGNANDSTGYGRVDYVYNIAVKEVNLSQYTAFLNAVAKTDTYSLYNSSMGTDLRIAGITRSGSPGSYSYAVTGSGDRPVTYVNWFDAARFANWLANGQPNGPQGNATTENGAYTLNGASSGMSFTRNGINPNTSAPPTYWIPSENEWYKAAYYDPTPGAGGGDNYWLYPTRSNSKPGNNIGAGTNQANFNTGNQSAPIYSVTQNATFSANQNYLTEGGAFSSSPSYYGTFDQGGNVWEINDDGLFHLANGTISRVRRGGNWYYTEFPMRSSQRYDNAPEFHYWTLGFRVASVASVPEPSTAVLILLGGAGWLLWRRRKFTL